MIDVAWRVIVAFVGDSVVPAAKVIALAYLVRIGLRLAQRRQRE
jgi:hypothetical protein